MDEKVATEFTVKYSVMEMHKLLYLLESRYGHKKNVAVLIKEAVREAMDLELKRLANQEKIMPLIEDTLKKVKRVSESLAEKQEKKAAEKRAAEETTTSAA